MLYYIKYKNKRPHVIIMYTYKVLEGIKKNKPHICPVV